jgi:hypothetical protein
MSHRPGAICRELSDNDAIRDVVLKSWRRSPVLGVDSARRTTPVGA